MNIDVLRREWGAAVFVLATIAVLLAVPLALYFANVSPSAITTPNVPALIPSASGARLPTPTPTPTPTPPPSPSASPSK